LELNQWLFNANILKVTAFKTIYFF